MWLLLTIALLGQADVAAPGGSTPPADARQTPPAAEAENSNTSAPDATETPDETQVSEAETGGLWQRVKDFFSTPPLGFLIEGGFFMWPILLMAILAAGVIIERYRSLKLLSSDSSAIRGQVKDLLQADQVQEALEFCDREQGPVPAVLHAGLRKYYVLRALKYDPAKVEEQVVKSMDDYSVHIVAELERHLPILATISSAAPMLGFLGTVQGMIVAFNDIVAKMGETNIVEAAADGIKVSLMTTCFGLIVGIPAFIAFNYFTSVINRFVLEVEESATELIEGVTLQLAIKGTVVDSDNGADARTPQASQVPYEG